MKIERRSVGTCILLSIVTLGIYGIIWEVKMAKEAVSVKDRNDDGLIEILLMIFLPFVGYYLVEKKFAEGCRNMGYIKEDRSTLYLILGLFALGIVNIIMLQSDLNNLSDALNQGFAPQTAAPGMNTNPQVEIDRIVNELEQYKSLFDQGIISEEEYMAKRNKLLEMI